MILQTFVNPASEPPNYAQVQGAGALSGVLPAENYYTGQALPPGSPITIDSIPPGLVTGLAVSSVTLTSSPGSVAADVRIWCFGFGDLSLHSGLGSQLPASWYQLYGAGPNLAVTAPPPILGPRFSLGWWLAAETTLSVGTPFGFSLPAGLVSLFPVATRLQEEQAAGVMIRPAGVPLPVPGYDDPTRVYTQAGVPSTYVRPPIAPVVSYTAFVALIGAVPGNYTFSVS
jgi:hypothetical protein